ncbi:MAG: Ger(x)C family spore germination protein [Bacillota bacterium]|nr:Ger(x)C family spore germination protein [Bacillota bacterium]
MKKHINIGVIIIICILMVSNLTACRSAHELNKLAIVMGVGIDKGKGKETVEMTVQLANVSGIKGSSQGGSGAVGSASYLNLKELGKSVSEATRAFSRKLNRKLFFSHNQVIIFGKDAAESGIEKYIDFFLRYRETRLLVWILVSDGNASDIFTIKPELEATPGMNIGELIKAEQEVSQVAAVDLKDFSSKLMSKTTAPVAPMIEVANDNNQRIAYLSKTAVFKKDKMIGTLDKKETRGLLWGTNKVKNGVIVIDKKGDKINIQTTHASGKITAQMKGDKPSIKIEIKQEGDLQEQSSSEDLANPKALADVQKAEEEIIKSEVMAAVAKAKLLNADIFGFGDTIYQHYPKQWPKLEKNWEKVFKNIPVEVSVNSKIRGMGRITKPIMSKEE